MSLFRRRSKAEPEPEPEAITTSEVRIVAMVPDDGAEATAHGDDQSDGDASDLLAELSEAFGDDASGASGAASGASGAADASDAADDTSDTADGEDHDADDTPHETSPSQGALTTIAIGGDDELPDAVYLDDDVGIGDDDSDTVFIDDDGTGDAVLPKDATGPGIEPRLRQRRIGVRRAEGRRRLKWFAIVGGLAAVVIAALAVLGSSLFAVDSFEISGVENADREEIAAVIDDLVGTPVLLVDTDAAEERLEAIAWVEGARVRTDFPSSVTVEIRERTPVATASGIDGRFRILDAEGRVLDVIDGQPVAFVLVTGTSTVDLESGQFADVGYSAAAAIVPKLTPQIRSRLVSMSTTPDGSDLRFVVSNPPGADIEVRLGAAITDNDQLERLVRLERVLGDVTGSDTVVIDVSTAETTER